MTRLTSHSATIFHCPVVTLGGGPLFFFFRRTGPDIAYFMATPHNPFLSRYMMTKLNVAGKTVILDNDHFLEDQNNWSHDVAREIAKLLGIPELDDEQLEIIEFLRNYYQKYKAFPILNYVCKHVEQPRGCLNNEFVDPMKAWKIAGLPKLDGIHFVTVDGKNYQLEECC